MSFRVRMDKENVKIGVVKHGTPKNGLFNQKLVCGKVHGIKCR